MDPRELALIQSQRGQALAIPGREVQVGSLGHATGPASPTPPPPPPPPPGDASAQSAGLLGVPWWAWAILAVGGYVAYRRYQQGR